MTLYELLHYICTKDSRCTPSVRQTVCQLLTQTENMTTASEEMIGRHTLLVYSAQKMMNFVLLSFALLGNQESINQEYLFPPASIRSRLHSLCDGDPEEALLAIKDFFGVSDFKEGKRIPFKLSTPPPPSPHPPK